MIEELGRQTVTLFAVLLVTFAGPFTAIAFLTRRRRMARDERRSPLIGDLLRGPGQALRDQLDELRIDSAFDLAILMVIPAVLLALYLLQLQIRRLPPAIWVDVLLIVGCAVFVAYRTRVLLRKSAHMDELRKGLDAEIAVGQELDQLMRQGAVVFHHFPAEKFNIDHVVLSPHGVFCVETKGYTKRTEGTLASATVEFDGRSLRFPERETSRPLEQAERQAQWFATWLSNATGSPITTIPVLALPGWYVERKGRGPVRVFSGRELSGLLKAGNPNALSLQALQQAVYQVEQRCRNVKPSFRADEDRK